MPAFDPVLLASWSGGSWSGGRLPARALSGFCVDSRKVGPGECFVALRTERRDGHEFLAAAAAAGAAAALVSCADASLPSLPQLVVPDPLQAFQMIAREHRRAFEGPVVGISGSCGKTSTKDLLALLLGGSEAGVLSTEGNLNNHIGVPLTLTRLDPARHAFAVVEAGIGAPGEMDPLARMIDPDLALITLVAPAHTQALGGLEGVAREKARLPAALRPAGMAVFPGQCAGFNAFRQLGVRRMVLEPADVLRPAEPPVDTVYFTVTQRGESTAIALAYGMPPPLLFTLPRVSAGMAQNAALALCSALWLGVAPVLIQERLQAWHPAALRGEIIEREGRMLYLDCYNANPASMRDALENFIDLAPAAQPRLFVLGCMEELGPDTAAYHRALGRQLQLRPADRVSIVGSESASVQAGLAESGASASQVLIAGSASGLAPLVASWPGPVFIKGSRLHRLETALPEGFSHS